VSLVGIVGGLGPESTIDYYRRIIALWQHEDAHSYPAIMIDSLDVNHGIELVRHDREGLIEYMLASVERLARAGCDFGAFAANTPHLVFDDVAARSPIPLLSIVAACADEAQRRGFSRVGLLGTGFTMEAGFYPRTFGNAGITVVVPEAHARAWLHERYLGELLKGDFRADTRDAVRALIHQLRTEHDVAAIVLAGTELPLLLETATTAGLPLLDSTELHVRTIVQRLRADVAHA